MHTEIIFFYRERSVVPPLVDILYVSNALTYTRVVMRAQMRAAILHPADGVASRDHTKFCSLKIMHVYTVDLLQTRRASKLEYANLAGALS
jgi:hypothetical protein